MYLQAEYYFDFIMRRNNSNSEAAFGLAICKMQDPNTYSEDVEQPMKIAARSEIYSTRDAANQMLQQIRKEQTKRAQQQNNSCFITTAVCGKADDCYALMTFRNFRDDRLAAQPDGKQSIAEYYSVAPRIVADIDRLADAAQIYKTIWQKYLVPCLNFIQSGDHLSCKRKYVEMILALKRKFLQQA